MIRLLLAVLLRRGRRTRRGVAAPSRAPVPLLACPHCHQRLTAKPGEYALFAEDMGRSVRASVDLAARAVHIDTCTVSGEVVRVASVQAMGTPGMNVRVWSPLQCSHTLRQRLPHLAWQAWHRASDLEGAPPTARRAWEGSRLARGEASAADTVVADGLQKTGDPQWPGQVLEESSTGGGGDAASPRLDAALATINAELDDWVIKFGGVQGPEFLRDPTALWVAIAQTLRVEFEHNPEHAIALTAGAMVRVILPPTRHVMPPDPFDESRT